MDFFGHEYDVLYMTHDVLYYQESVMTRSSRRNPDLSCATTNTIDWDLVVSNLAVDLGMFDPVVYGDDFLAFSGSDASHAWMRVGSGGDWV